MGVLHIRRGETGPILSGGTSGLRASTLVRSFRYQFRDPTLAALVMLLRYGLKVMQLYADCGRVGARASVGRAKSATMRDSEARGCDSKAVLTHRSTSRRRWLAIADVDDPLANRPGCERCHELVG